jgi:hypothetical protein
MTGFDSIPHFTVICFIAGIQACLADGPVHYVSPDGDDRFPGTKEKPWLSLAQAAEKAHAGSTVLLMDGIYRETLRISHSGSPDKPVVFAAAPGARPVISARDPLAAPVVRDGRWETPLPWTLGVGRDHVFLSGDPLTEARHPNVADSNPMTPEWTSIRFTASNVISSNVFHHATKDHWRGAWFHGHGSKAWAAQCARVSTSSGNKIQLDDETLSSPWFAAYEGNGDPHAEKKHPGAAYLFGLPVMLDAPGEWLRVGETLLIIPPAGAVVENGSLEVKRREFTVDLSNKDHVFIRGLTLEGGAVRMRGNGNRLEHCSLRHASHFQNFSSGYSQNGGRPEGSAIDLGGNDSTVSHCTVSMTAGCGILIRGERNQVTRCLVEDIGYAGTYGGGITIAGADASVTFNTVRRTGRDCIHFCNTIPGGQGGADILYNDASFPGQICKDAGILYVFGRNAISASGRPTRIAWNWFHDQPAPLPSPGIYIDNYCRNFIVHHNVIWNVPNDAGIRINGPSEGCRIFNNTLHHTHDVGTFTYRRFETDNPEPAFWKGREHYSFESLNNLHLADNPAAQLTDPANHDFTLLPASPSIDAGVPVRGFDGPPGGVRPDLGAYERGQPPWKPGHLGHRPGEPVVMKSYLRPLPN